MNSPIDAIRGCLRESAMAISITSGVRSKWRLIADIWLSRVLAVFPTFGANGLRSIRCRPDITVSYRFNRGDLQSIREVLCEQAYRLPFDRRPKVLVDLGANIGLTSLWLHTHYGCERIIGVEADPENAKVLRENYLQNKLPGEVIEAAVGPYDGVAVFKRSSISNMGAVARRDAVPANEVSNIEVPMVSMETVLKRLPAEACIDVLKMDIEGGEQALITGPREWLKRTHAIIAELHPGLVDCERIVRILEEEGFAFIPANSVFPGNMTAFVRKPPARR